MAQQDFSAFNPHIAALAMPQSGIFSEAGKALKDISSTLRNERIGNLQEQALGQNIKLNEQQYNFNALFNPLKLDAQRTENKKSIFDLERARNEEAHRTEMRPLERNRAQLQNEGIKASNNYTNAQTSELWSNTNIEANLGRLNMAENPRAHYHNLRESIRSNPKLTQKKRHELLKTLDRAGARFGFSKGEDASMEEEALFERVRDNPHIAAHYGALDDDGKITEDKFYKIFQSSLSKAPRHTLATVDRLMRDNQKFSEKSSAVFKRVAEYKDALDWARGEYGNNHAEDYLGAFDSLTSGTKRLFNVDDGSNGFFQLIDYLKQDAKLGLRLTKSEKERQELKEITEMSPYGIIFEGKELGRFQKLINAAMNAKRAQIEEDIGQTENKWIKQELARKLAEVDTLQNNLLEFGNAPLFQKKPQWQDLTPSNTANPAQAPSPAPVQNSSMQNPSAQAPSSSALTPEREQEIESLWR
ncbi:MAG: hypothetical protein ACTTH5_07460 [Wolinella sp.]